MNWCLTFHRDFVVVACGLERQCPQSYQIEQATNRTTDPDAPPYATSYDCSTLALSVCREASSDFSRKARSKSFKRWVSQPDNDSSVTTRVKLSCGSNNQI